MQIDKHSWFHSIRTVARQFIEDNYGQESSLFDDFWQAFSFKVEEALDVNHHSPLTLNTASQVITDISFAQSYDIDLVTPVVLPTVAEVLRHIQMETISNDKLQSLIASTARHFGAQASLTACLLRALPPLCHELQSYDPTADESIVTKAPAPQYRIWTEGEKRVAISIEKYEKNKDTYLFWIDLDKQLEPPLSPESIKLLRYLIKNVGNRKSVVDILRDVFSDTVGCDEECDRNKITQQLTKLHKYSDKKFRGHLFANWTEHGLGLQDSFKKKYFLFCRVI